jgi:two-component system sensor histidine kinase YesM
MISQKIEIETNAIKQMAYNIEAEINKNMFMASAIVHDEKIMNTSFALKEATTTIETYQNSKSLDALLNSFFVSNNFVGEVYLVFDDKEKMHVSRNTSDMNANYDFLTRLTKNSSTDISSAQIVDEIFLKPGEFNPTLLAIVTYPPSNWGYKESYTKEVLVSPIPVVKQFYKKDAMESSSIIMLVNSKNKIMASNKSNLINTKYNQDALKETNKIVITENLDTTNWKLIKVLDPKTITANVDRLFLIATILISILIFSYLIYNYIVLVMVIKPLNQLIRNMGEVGKGNYKKDSYVTHFDELENLSCSFNSMVQELEDLHNQIIKAHKETIMREIEALRFQINPHFMCNSLSSIRMMAMISKNDNIKRMSTALMIIMEDNLNGTGSFTSISHELQNIDSYVYIMQVRYGNSFNYEKIVDKECLDAEVPSMLLQPLIENTILHGFREIEKQGFISLRIKKEKEIIKIIIRDNGKGINKKEIDELFNDDKTHNKGLNHIGLNNVKRRLELLYPNVGKIEITGDDSKCNSYFQQEINIPFNLLDSSSLEIVNRTKRR